MTALAPDPVAHPPYDATSMRVPKRARVLLVAPQPFFEPRGTPMNVLQMARTLGAAGHDVHLATFGVGQPVEIPGVTIHRAMRLPGVTSVPIGFSGRKLAMDAMLALLVQRLLLTRRWDLAHAVEESVFFTLPLARLRGIPVIYDMDSSISHQLAYSGKLRRSASLELVRGMERAALRRSALALTVCRALTDAARELVPGVPIAQIEDAPLDDALRDADPAAVRLLRERHQLGDRPVAVYTGNLEGYQGIDLLLDAWPHALRRTPEARLLLVGGEPAHVEHYRGVARRLGVEGSVVLAGRQPSGAMPEYMALADVLVSPRTEGSNTPLKLYSYMHAGRPIVCTDLETHRQVLDERTAVLARPEGGDYGEKLGDALANPELYAPRGRLARETVEREYSLPVFRRKLLEAYERVLSGSRSTVARSM